MKKLTIIGITLGLLLGVALWQQKHIVVGKAAPMLATQTVTTTADSGLGSLRQAIADAASGDTITFDTAGVFAAPQTIFLLSQLVINKNLTILGTDASKLTVSGNDTVRVFRIIAGNFNVTISGLTIANGSGGDQGGGILNESMGTLNVTNCTISDNSVARTVNSGDAEGGGIANEGTGTLNVTNCTISGNSAGGLADALGGGIANVSHSVSVAAGTVNITNSTISGNSAITSSLTHGGVGGGVFNQTGTVNVTNSTVAGNSASSTTSGGQGGGIYNFSSVSFIAGTVNVKSTIIALNTASVSDPDVHGAFTSQGYNLIGNGSGGSGFSATGDQVNVANPGLELNMGQPFLKDNGGPTWTIALVCDSPAIDKGKNFSASATDQRGAPFVRPFDDPTVPPATDGDNTDIGAFEMQQVCNTNPTITGEAISRQQGSPAPTSPEQIASVDDAESGPGGVTVTITSPNPSNGVTVSNIVNTNGTVTADVEAACGATSASFTLTATDGDGATATATLTVNVTPNTAPTLVYPSPQSVNFNGFLNVTPTTASDNGSITGYAVQSVVPALTTAPTVNASGVVSITNAQPPGSHVITIHATDNCGAPTDAQFTLVVNAALPPADVEIEKSDAPDPVLLTNNITYEIEVENEGPGAATNVVVTDSLPAGVTFVSASAGCSYNAGDHKVTCLIGNLAKDREAERRIVVHPTSTGNFTNVASVKADQLDPKPSNNTDAASTRVVVGVASLTLSPTSVKGGSSVIVTGTVTLSGPAPSGGQVVTLSSSSNSVAKPAVNSITIPAGSTGGTLGGGTFTVKHFKVSSTKTAKIKASANGFSREATLTVTKN